MSVTDWFLLLATCLAGAASPGPSLALLISSTLVGGRRAGIIFGIGHGAGILLYASLTVTGLETVLLKSPSALFYLQITGCGFLLWVAFKMITGSNHGISEENRRQYAFNTPQPKSWPAFEGFLIVFFNPKIAAFFFAIFSQFFTSDQNAVSKAGMVSVAWLVDTMWYILIALIVTIPQLTPLVEGYRKKIELFIGYAIVFICFGLLWRAFEIN